jgi:hypothetical protein
MPQPPQGKRKNPNKQRMIQLAQRFMQLPKKKAQAKLQQLAQKKPKLAKFIQGFMRQNSQKPSGKKKQKSNKARQKQKQKLKMMVMKLRKMPTPDAKKKLKQLQKKNPKLAKMLMKKLNTSKERMSNQSQAEEQASEYADLPGENLSSMLEQFQDDDKEILEDVATEYLIDKGGDFKNSPVSKSRRQLRNLASDYIQTLSKDRDEIDEADEGEFSDNVDIEDKSRPGSVPALSSNR